MPTLRLKSIPPSKTDWTYRGINDTILIFNRIPSSLGNIQLLLRPYLSILNPLIWFFATYNANYDNNGNKCWDYNSCNPRLGIIYAITLLLPPYQVVIKSLVRAQREATGVCWRDAGRTCPTTVTNAAASIARLAWEGSLIEESCGRAEISYSIAYCFSFDLV